VSSFYIADDEFKGVKMVVCLFKNLEVLDDITNVAEFLCVDSQFGVRWHNLPPVLTPSSPDENRVAVFGRVERRVIH
jgi:hypothetical protein